MHFHNKNVNLNHSLFHSNLLFLEIQMKFILRTLPLSHFYILNYLRVVKSLSSGALPIPTTCFIAWSFVHSFALGEGLPIVCPCTCPIGCRGENVHWPGLRCIWRSSAKKLPQQSPVVLPDVPTMLVASEKSNWKILITEISSNGLYKHFGNNLLNCFWGNVCKSSKRLLVF